MPASKKLSATSKKLISLAQAIVRSASHLEDNFWELELTKTIDKALTSKRQDSIENALEFLLQQRSAAYEILVEYAESCSECVNLTKDGQTYDALLFCAPVLARTRYQLPAGKLNKKELSQLKDLITNQITAPDVQLALVPRLVRFDDLPQSFKSTRELNLALAKSALGLTTAEVQAGSAETTADLLADAYFIVGSMVVPNHAPIFNWQLHINKHIEVRDKLSVIWSSGCTDIFKISFAGCINEYLIPDAYYTNTRRADQYLRPISLKASITWLDTVAQTPATELRAAIVACGNDAVEEYRIGFSTKNSNEVIYGCIWPSLNREEAIPDQLNEGQISPWDIIAAVLKDCGINTVRVIPEIQPMDFCDDCEAPYFPNMLGEMLHPELPADIDLDPIRFH